MFQTLIPYLTSQTQAKPFNFQLTSLNPFAPWVTQFGEGEHEVAVVAREQGGNMCSDVARIF